MKVTESHILIVGGGPVGLLMGLCLHHQGIDFTLLEKRTQTIPDSRSLGIHPPSLEIFDELGITDQFLEKGLKVEKGMAHTGTHLLGVMQLNQLPPPHSYVLLIPQSNTEEILKQELQQRAPNSLIEGAEFLNCEQLTNRLSYSYKEEDSTFHGTADFLIGCDGKNSRVREQLDIPFNGNPYPDTYIMGDFDDNTELGAQAALFLHPDGLVESFPLPDKKRRWVVKTNEFVKDPDTSQLAELVRERTQQILDENSATMLSGFGVQHYVAEQFVEQRVILIGDAAHVVSPIGGQGMNLGWLDAWNLSLTFHSIFNRNRHDFSTTLAQFELKQKLMAKKVAQRAEWNMAMGRKTRFPVLKYLFLKLFLIPPIKKFFLKRFTMRGL